jgi:nuclear pore complex protein Nup133
MQPHHALGAFSDHLDRRFRNFDADFQAKLKDAMKWEDKVLSQYIERNRVAMWLDTILDAARRDVRAELDEATAADAAATTMALDAVYASP